MNPANITNKKIILFLTGFFITLLLFLFSNPSHPADTFQMVMGGRLYHQASEDDKKEITDLSPDAEKYFRPSNQPVLNNRYTYGFFREYFERPASEINLPDYLFKTPEDTLINYFSILREAANPQKDKLIGCGTIGNAILPYPIAYDFLSSSYRKELSYEQYLNTFRNILHISLIKYREVPVYDNPSGIVRYFVELETIEGSDKNVGYFAYYYGFADVIKKDGLYKISNLKFTGENYLCAPYHGWYYDAELNVLIRYGGWCSLIKELYPTIQNGYVKHIFFKGTDGNDYMIEFYQLTNDTDIEIAQYRKGRGAHWELIKYNPEDCIRKGR